MNDVKKAIIVGASSGIGMETAKLLLSDGWHLGVAARREEPLQELKAMAPERIEVMTIDVTKPDAGDRLLSLINRLGGIDLYFHASGIGKQNRTLEADIELQTMETNAVGFTRMIGTAYRYFAEKGEGHIAAITSIAGTKGLGPAPAYSATKALQATYLQALEQQTRQRGLYISFTDIRPGFVDTALLNGDFPYPMLMQPETVARDIVSSIYRKRHVRIIDGRYRVLTFFWRLIPRWLWRRLTLLFVMAGWLLPSLMHAQTSRAELLAHLDLAAGNYSNYPNPTGHVTPAPDGYEPFYVSHYGRHGARYMTDDKAYKYTIGKMDTAQARDWLTDYGKEVLGRLKLAADNAHHRDGDLTQLGGRQHRAIAHRLVRNYPELLMQPIHVKANSSTVRRCMLSMANFCQELMTLNRKQGSDDILVKFLMNENETSVPIQTDCYPFYHWKDVSNHYRNMLKEANITYKTKIEKEDDDEDD
jgi:short-subunit dehydrogenase